MTLSPPPGFANLNTRRWVLGAEPNTLARRLKELEPIILILIKFSYPSIGLLAILRYAKYRYARYKRSILRVLVNFSKTARRSTSNPSEPKLRLYALLFKLSAVPASYRRIQYWKALLANMTGLDAHQRTKSSLAWAETDAIKETTRQGIETRSTCTGMTSGGIRRRRILRNRHSHNASTGKRGNSIMSENMDDDSSSDEVLYARQGGCNGETRRSSRIRLRRRTAGVLRE